MPVYKYYSPLGVQGQITDNRLTYRGYWDKSYDYTEWDVVSADSFLYVALKSGSGKYPLDWQNGHWALLIVVEDPNNQLNAPGPIDSYARALAQQAYDLALAGGSSGLPPIGSSDVGKVLTAISESSYGLDFSSGVSYQLYVNAGTYNFTKPSYAKLFYIICVAGGSGGGSGRRGAVGTQCGGGGGGAGGSIFFGLLPAYMFPTTFNVTVGAGGLGGAGVTTDSTNGNAGTLGGNSLVDTIGAKNNTGTGGGGTTTGGSGGGSSTWGIISGMAGGAGGSGAAGSSSSGSGGCGGGGGGGGISTTEGVFGGGLGITWRAFHGSNVPGASAGQNGGDGYSKFFAGGGGGGGGSSVTANGGNGGNGGWPGGGGGGGGASRDGFTSGAGGNGADGAVLIATMF